MTVRAPISITSRFAVALSVLAALAVAAPAPAQDTDLAALQQRAHAAAEKALPAVVAFVAPGSAPAHHQSGASGVIITPDGLVLSQFHVTHMLGDFDHSRKPGERATVVLADGRCVHAELLGADRTYDLSLAKLVEPGPYPHVALDGVAGARLGDWVLKAGHPSGYRAGRSPPVRLGRVVCAVGDTFATDCAIDGGDSGGPFFDLDGRLLGIIRSDLGTRPIQAAAPEYERRVGGLCAGTPAGVIAARLDSMRRGQISPVDARVMSKWVEALAGARVLPPAQWTQGALRAGRGWKGSWAAPASVVEVLDGDSPVALGTAVEGGAVLTKASELPAEPRCRLPDDTMTAAEVAGVDPASDLALLRPQQGADKLRAVTWADAAAPVGTIVGAPGADGKSMLATGVVSVARRELPGPFPQRLERGPAVPAAPPEVIGSAVEGRGYWVEFVEGAAAAAGVLPGDVLLSAGDVPLRHTEDLARCVNRRAAGERLTVRLVRGGKHVECVMRLRGEGQHRFSGRRDDFPAVLEHDAPLLAGECGGPLVDLDGHVLGITIARVGPHGCMALPSDLVRKVLAELSSGKLAQNWTPPARATAAPATRETAAESAAGEPVSVSLDEIKRRLTERRARFKSLLVEYETRAEAQVEATLLMTWGLHDLRDDRELHRVAFSGDKRLVEVRRPALTALGAPRDQVTADPAAPPALAKAVEQRRAAAAREKEQGRLGHLFLRGGPPQKIILDGQSCFVPSPDGKKAVRRPPDFFSSPTMYLAAVGLRPPDPSGAASQKQYWFPDNFEQYEKARLLPETQVVDRAACVVVDGERTDRAADGTRHVRQDRLWLDPALGYAPRRREQRSDGALVGVWRCEDFDEFAPGCVLPWSAELTVPAPAWAAPEFRGRPAYTCFITLRRAKVNDVPQDLFQPDAPR